MTQDFLLWATVDVGYLRLADNLVQISSIMPQKRNPAALEQLRAQASIMLGEMQTVFLMGHNNRTGMFDYRSYDPVPCARPLQVFRLFQQVVDGIVVNRERASGVSDRSRLREDAERSLSTRPYARFHSVWESPAERSSPAVATR